MPDHSHKRSDPEKLAREGREIIQSKLNLADQATHESVFNQIGRMFKEARDRRQMEINPPPEIRGAKVIGVKEHTET